MLGLEIAEGWTNGDIVTALMEADLLTVPAADNVVRLLPPLIIGEAEIDEAVSTIDEHLRTLAENRTAEGAAS